MDHPISTDLRVEERRAATKSRGFKGDKRKTERRHKAAGAAHYSKREVAARAKAVK